MTKGVISKLVSSFGSTWGRIKPAGEVRELFFNAGTLVDYSQYNDLVLGQEVEFDEEPDRANGSHAIHVRHWAHGHSFPT
jgi:cold shock CspA family protein